MKKAEPEVLLDVSATAESSSAIHDALWRPSAERRVSSQFEDFQKRAREVSGMALTSSAELHQWSIDAPEAFWSLVWDYCDVTSEKVGDTVLSRGDAIQDARWFPEARLNFAENLLRRRDDHAALIFWGEDRIRREISFSELFDHVAGLSNALRSAGVVPGDRVAAYLPNLPEAIIGMLATASIGAVWSSCSPDFGVAGVADRFGQIEPKILLCADGYFYNGKSFDSLAHLPEILSHLPSVECCVVVAYIRDALSIAECRDLAAPTNCRVESFNAFSTQAAATSIEFEILPFDHPLAILYSSGTTGKPKCIVHGAGGTLLQHLKEHRLHVDLREGDRFFYFTTCGWMMWNWLASGLASGATLVLYDGSPFFAAPGRAPGTILFDLVDREEIQIFGTSAKFIDAVAKSGLVPRETHDLASLRTLLSTGSPLVPESFDFVYAHIKSDLHLASISGGTDILSCFVLGYPTEPVWRGEIQGAGLGMAVEVFDDSGRPLDLEMGELVCTRPFPSMPIGFWNDPDRARFEAAYFERFEDVWCHGDWICRTGHGGFVITGRSDAILNPGGVRIGTAEIYRAVEQLDPILEAVAVGQQWEGDVRVVLFVILRGGAVLDEGLRSKIRAAVREGTSPRHVPARILQVEDIPRTRSGKITELAVRDTIHGAEIKNTEALANPEALAGFTDRPELRE